MSEKTIYIPPRAGELTGFSSYVYFSTNTSDLTISPLSQDDNVYFAESRVSEDEGQVCYEFHAERRLDKSLREFYKKKGYEVSK